MHADNEDHRPALDEDYLDLIEEAFLTGQITGLSMALAELSVIKIPDWVQ